MGTSIKKVGILGDGGAIQTTTAFVCALRKMPIDLVLIDQDEKVAEARALDIADACLEHGMPNISHEKLPLDAGHFDIIVICIEGGLIERTTIIDEQTMNARAAWLRHCSRVLTLDKSHCILIIVGSPNEILCEVAREAFSLYEHQVIGMGTAASVRRHQRFFAELLKVSPTSIGIPIVGESCANEVVLYSNITVASLDFSRMPTAHKYLDKDLTSKYFTKLKSECYTLAHCVADVIDSIIFDRRNVYCLAVFHRSRKARLSWPAIIGCHGVSDVIDVTIAAAENAKVEEASLSLASRLKTCTVLEA